MGALVGSRYNPVLRGLYQRLLTAGKPKKVALTACMQQADHHPQCHDEEPSAVEFTGHHTLTSKTVAGHLRLPSHTVAEQGAGDGVGPLRIRPA